jgi:hypothetical protein
VSVKDNACGNKLKIEIVTEGNTVTNWMYQVDNEIGRVSLILDMMLGGHLVSRPIPTITVMKSDLDVMKEKDQILKVQVITT